MINENNFPNNYKNYQATLDINPNYEKSAPNIKIENLPILSDNRPTISEQSIMNDIQSISNKIATKKTFNLSSLSNYAQILKTLEENRTRFVEGQSIDLKPLQSFASSSEQLTSYMESLIDRFNALSNIDNATIMSDIHSNIDKINKFVSTSEQLFNMMDHPDQYEWFSKYNDTVLSIKKSMNAYENVAKQITHQLSDPVNLVNPQIKSLTEMFNANYINNPLPNNFMFPNPNSPPPSISSLPSLDLSQDKIQDKQITSNNVVDKDKNQSVEKSSVQNIILVFIFVLLLIIVIFIFYYMFVKK